MNSVKRNLSRINQRASSILLHKYLLLRSLIGLSFFVLSVYMFVPFAKSRGDLFKGALLLYTIFVILLCLALIAGFIRRTIMLQNDVQARNYSIIVSLNSFIGLILPLIYSNALALTAIKIASQITNYGTFFCQIRCSIVREYYQNGIYAKMSDLIYLLIVMTFVLLIFGSFIEKMLDNHRKSK